jgi:hypothetical protein
MDLGQWSVFRGCGPFSASKSDHSFAGISGGATSGMMAALLPPYVRLCFENTGREHPNTYEFLRELATALGREITWLEFRKPQVKGARPRDFDFAVVDYATADRSGGPFEAFMEAIAEYRETKGEPPLSPWARQRIVDNREVEVARSRALHLRLAKLQPCDLASERRRKFAQEFVGVRMLSSGVFKAQAHVRREQRGHHSRRGTA